MITRGRIAAAEAVFFAVSALSLFGALYLLPLALAMPSASTEAVGIGVSLLAAGLPVPLGIVAGRLTQGVGQEHRLRPGLAAVVAAGAILATALGGFAAPFVYLSYFVAVTMMRSVLRLRVGIPPFSFRMAIETAAAVIVSAIMLGHFFGQLLNLVTRFGR